jgi:hypothetical protein
MPRRFKNIAKLCSAAVRRSAADLGRERKFMTQQFNKLRPLAPAPRHLNGFRAPDPMTKVAKIDAVFKDVQKRLDHLEQTAPPPRKSEGARP